MISDKSVNRRVVITGMGVISPLGLTVDEFWDGLVNGSNGIGMISSFDTTNFPIKIAAEVKNFDPVNYMDGKRADRCGRASQMAIAATKMAIASAKFDMGKERKEKVGVVIATSGMVTLIAEQSEVIKTKGPNRIDPLFINKLAPSMVSSQVGLEFTARGPNTSLNSACASGSDALGTALNLIRLGRADVMIAGGAECVIHPVTVAGTARVGALSKETDPGKACRPFDFDRNGFIYGEGSAIMILEAYEHAVARGATILAELAGAGWTFDAYNDTAPDAEMQAVAMKMAIEDAGLKPEHIDHVNAHGTSTKLNDAAETKAIKIVFGERAYKIPVTSNKSMIGHLACAAGSIEAVAAVMTINKGVIPPTVNYQTPDPDCDLDYVPNKARKQSVTTCLSNSFGMGGQNCCLVIRKFIP